MQYIHISSLCAPLFRAKRFSSSQREKNMKKFQNNLQAQLLYNALPASTEASSKPKKDFKTL
jgi:hypothetical protein